MAYKVLKIDCRAKNVAKYVCNHGTKFETFAAIIWLVLDRIRGVKCSGPQTFDLVLYVTPNQITSSSSSSS